MCMVGMRTFCMVKIMFENYVRMFIMRLSVLVTPSLSCDM